MGRKKKFPNPYEDPKFADLMEECAELRKWYYEVCEPMFKKKEMEDKRKVEAKKQAARKSDTNI